MKKILIAEDEAATALDIKTVLQRKGYDVLEIAYNAKDAVNFARLERPDLVLMDITLAGKSDGIEAAAQILREHCLPIIFITAYVEESVIKRAKSIGSYGYLVKPLNRHELYSSVEIALYKFDMDRKLRESRDRAQALLNAIPDMMYRFSRDGVVLDYRADRSELYVPEAGPVIGRRLKDLTPPAFASNVMKKIEECLDKGVMTVFEYELELPGKGLKQYEARMVPSGTEEVTSIVRDISERKQEQAKRIENEKRLSLAHQVAGIGYWELDPVSEKLMMSENTYEIFGLDPDMFRPTFENFEALVHPDDVERNIRERQWALENGRTVDLEFRTVLPDGTVRYIRQISENIFNGAGEVTKIIGSVQDITEQKLIHIQLLENQKFLSMAHRIAGIGLWEWFVLEDEFIWDYNTYEIFGQDPNTFRPSARSFSRLVHEDDIEKLAAAREDCLRDHCPSNLDFRIILKDGSIRYLNQVTENVKDESGAIVKIIGTVQDITERKKNEKALQDSLHEKEILLRELHHRVKNNFQSILSLIHLQENRISDPEVLESFRDTRNRIRSMSLVHESLFRSEDMTSIDFSVYLNRLVDELSFSYDYNNRVRVIKELDPVCLDIDSSVPCALMINEILINCYKYAFCDADDCEIRIAFRKMLDGKHLLEIKDNGCGLPDDFDIKRSSSMGLKLVRNFLKQLDGDMELSVDNGTAFRFVFPAN